MKVSKQVLADSTKIRNLENEMSQILEKSGKMDLAELKSNFKYRASLETVRHITQVSDKMGLLDNNFVNFISGYGDITYTINGGDIKSAQLNKTSIDLGGDTVPCALYGDNYEFELRVYCNRLDDWTFTVTNISMEDGNSIRTANPINDNGEKNVFHVKTYPQP